MADELSYPPDLYKGTAEYYDRFRPPYPAILLDDLRARVPIRPQGRVLDLACGTGHVAFALASDVAEVWAIDQEVESITYGKGKAVAAGVTNIHWITGTAEDVALSGQFDLVTVGNAFHRLRRNAVAERLAPHLSRHGCIVLLWASGPMRGNLPWQRALEETVDRWRDRLGVRDRVPEGWEEAMERDPHEQVLRRAGLSYEGCFEFSLVHRWTTDSLIGYVYSTSMLNRTVLQDQVPDFESDVRAKLLDCCGNGPFEQDLSFTYELARCPL